MGKGERSVATVRYDALAMMICEGISVDDIADQMSLPTEVVLRYYRGDGPDGFNKILQGYKKKLFDAQVDRRFRFIEMSPKAYRRIEESLDGKDARLASDNAWKIIEEVSPRQVQPGISATVNLTQNNQVNAQILEATQGLVEAIVGLKKSNTPSFAKHLKSGDEALPTAYRQVQEEDAERGDTIEVPVANVREGEPATAERS